MVQRRKIQSSFAILTFLLLSALAIAIAPSSSAQPLVVLHAFSAEDSASHNLDGAGPNGLAQVGDTLYGAACCAGQYDFGISLGMGTIYALNRDGGDFRVLHQFEGSTIDGGRPSGGLVASSDGNLLFGTVSYAGDVFLGGIYSIQNDGSNFTLLHAFAGEDGDTACPLTLVGDTLYGVNLNGSTSNGALYSVKTNGSDFHLIHSFTPFQDPTTTTNSDGAVPIRGGLTLEGNVLYGATSGGGKNGRGTIFKINLDGTGFTVLRDSGPVPTNRLIVSSGVLCGSTWGVNAAGTVFSLNTDGSNFRTLHTFLGAGSPPTAIPTSLLVSGDKLYGAISSRYSPSASGSIFQMNLDGTAYKVLYSLSAQNQQGQNTNGAWPGESIIRIDNELYFTAGIAGPSGSGTVDRLALPISPATLAIQIGGNGRAATVVDFPNAIRLNIYGDLAATYILEDTDLLPSNTWRNQQNIVITQNPVTIDLPSATAPTYWRARVLQR